MQTEFHGREHLGFDIFCTEYQKNVVITHPYKGEGLKPSRLKE